jgi:methionine-rich copper-binding protein CopC
MPSSPRPSLPLATILLIVVISLWASTESAAAHAGYRESSPTFAEELPGTPDRIELRFTQQLFRRAGANTLELVGPDGPLEGLGPGTIDNDDRRVLSLRIEAGLPVGRYLVRWTNLSADDGDSDEGVYPFYVGRVASVEEQDLDRELAADLLIPYPGDVPEDDSDEAPPPPVPFAERASVAGDGIGAGLIVLAVLGGIAAVGVSLSWARRRQVP